MIEIKGKKGRDIYYYDEKTLFITDKEGNKIKLYESLDSLSDGSRIVVFEYIDSMFKKLYVEQNEIKKLSKFLKEKKLL